MEDRLLVTHPGGREDEWVKSSRRTSNALRNKGGGMPIKKFFALRSMDKFYFFSWAVNDVVF